MSDVGELGFHARNAKICHRVRYLQAEVDISICCQRATGKQTPFLIQAIKPFVGDLGGSSMPFSKAWSSNPGAVEEMDLVTDDPPPPESFELDVDSTSRIVYSGINQS